MKRLNKLGQYLLAVWSIAVVIIGFYFGSKFGSKTEFKTEIKKVRAKKGGTIIIKPESDLQQTTTKKRFRIRKKDRVKNQ